MNDDDEIITCLQCGLEIQDSRYDQHMEQEHGIMTIREPSKAQQRLEAKEAKSGKGLKIAAGAVFAVIILLAANFILFQGTDDQNNNDDLGDSFQDTEYQPDIVSVPGDD
jgi:hypothetical protein